MEAMKMENEIRAPHAGVVKARQGHRGQAVETGADLRDRLDTDHERMKTPTDSSNRSGIPSRRPTGPRTPRSAAGGAKPDLGEPGEVSVHSRRSERHVPRPPLDDAPVRGFRHGRRIQQALSLPAFAGDDGAFGGLRSADAAGLRPDHARSQGEVGKVGVSISTLDDMRTLFSGIDLAQSLDLDDDQRDGEHSARVLRRGRRGAGRAGRASCAAPFRTTCSRNTSRAETTSIRPKARSGSRPTCSPGARRTRPNGIRSASRATTSAKPARRPCRSWRSPSPTRSLTSKPRSRAGLTVDSVRGTAFFLLQRPQRFLRGDRQVPRRAPDLG